MNKRFWLLGGLTLLELALAQSTYSFTINGKPFKLETLESGGEVYVEAQYFAKALGAQVTFDKAKKSFVIISSRAAPSDVQGTTQLAGGEGVLGKTYSLGKTTNALNFTLTSLEFSVSPVTMGTFVYAPKAGSSGAGVPIWDKVTPKVRLAKSNVTTCNGQILLSIRTPRA